jgi:ABC-type nitrate/sulfonate/bicarbonate transport system substrate-binding protein
MKKTARMKKTKTVVSIVAVLVSALLMLSACSNNSGSSGASSDDSSNGASSSLNDSVGSVEEEPYTIKLQGIRGNKSWVDAPTVAVERGIFTAHGLEIEDVGVLQVGQWITALQSGTLDIASVMTSEALVAIDNGVDIISIAGDTDTYYPEKPHMTFLVKKGSPIKTGKDFVGKKIGISSVVGGCTAGFPIEFMRQDGVEDAINQANLIAVPETSLIDALEQDEVDVVGTHFIPEVVEKLYGDQYEIVFSDYDILGRQGGDKDWFTTRKFAEEHPDVIRKFVAAIAEVNNWIDENPDEAIEVYTSVSDINEEIFHVRHYTIDGLVNQDNTQLWIDLLRDPGQIGQLTNITSADQVSTNEFNEKG